MKIGVSSYSFDQLISKGVLNQLDCIKKAKELGINFIEFTDLNPPEGVDIKDFAKQIRIEAEKEGVGISAYVVGANLAISDDNARKAEIERVKGAVDIANILGVKLFRHDVMWDCKDFRSYNEALPVISEAAREITVYAEQFGIRTMTENHGQIFQDPDRMEQLIAAVNHKNYGLLLDMGNFLCADICSANAVSRVANLAFMVHCKDFIVHKFEENVKEGYLTRGMNRLEGVSLGEGDANVKLCLAILKNAGFDGHIDIEYEGAGDCFEGIKKGYDFIVEALG